MDEALFPRLAALAATEPVVLAHVVATRGATPRKRDARMLIAARETQFSVGGGEAEARVIAAGRELLTAAPSSASLVIDLSGRPGAAGICGGTMTIALSRWYGESDSARLRAISTALSEGKTVRLPRDELGDDTGVVTLRPRARLVIVGAGHCGAALAEIARLLDFDRVIYDARAELADDSAFAGMRGLFGDTTRLASALDTERAVYAVLLNRDFATDVATLRVLCARRPRFIGMMGSRKRIAEVVAALPEHAQALSTLHAPVGIELGAETPHEIAVSIAAQLVAVRAQHRAEDAARPERDAPVSG
jgi:xanthine dehydrogenase accessory factor